MINLEAVGPEVSERKKKREPRRLIEEQRAGSEEDSTVLACPQSSGHLRCASDDGSKVLLSGDGI